MSDEPVKNGQHGPAIPSPQLPFGRKAVGEIEHLEELIGNALLARSEFFQSILDPRRNLDSECGYPDITQSIGSETYKQLYDREAVANRVVQVLPKESWQVTPLVYEDEKPDKSTEFEEAWDELEVTLSGKSYHQDESGSTIWEHLLRADILSGIGHFGIMLLGIDDGKDLQEPVEGSLAVNRNGLVLHDSLPHNKEKLALVANGYHSSRYENWLERVQDAVRPAHVIGDDSLPLPTQNDYWGQGPQSSGYAPKHEVSELTGTDLQYAWQGAIPPAALSGTDAQYFGVQFGASEVPNASPAKGKPKQLLFLRSFDESLVQVVRYEWNIRNPRFGMPVMYRVTLNDPRETHSGVGLPLATVYVHWSRVIHLADNLGSSEIFGVPRMRPVLNRLLDLRKLYSGSAEMYWRGAFPGLSLETHPQLGGDVKINVAQQRDVMEQYMNGLQRYLLLMGMSAKTLSPTVVDPSPQIATQIEAICIQIAVPVPVFKGYEIGEQASENNDKDWNDRLAHRQKLYLNPRVICPFIDRLILLNVLPEPEGYTVEWPDMNTTSDQDKATVFLTRTQAYAAAIGGNVETIFTPLDMMTKLDSMTEEEAEVILKDAEKAVGEKKQEAAEEAESQGFEPAPPEGFKSPEPPPVVPPMAPAAPVKLNPGQQLVSADGKPIFPGSSQPPGNGKPKLPAPKVPKPKTGP